MLVACITTGSTLTNSECFLACTSTGTDSLELGAEGWLRHLQWEESLLTLKNLVLLRFTKLRFDAN